MPRKKPLTPKQQKILDCLEFADTDLSPADIAQVTGDPPSTVSAIIRTRLLPFGLVRRYDRGRYESTGKPA